MSEIDEAEVEAIAAKLTKPQREALLHPNAGGCSYRWTRIGTLDALRTRQLVGFQAPCGSMFSPQTAIKWPLTALGLAVRSHLIARP